MAPLSPSHPVAEELMKRDRLAAVIAMLRRCAVEGNLDRMTMDQVLAKIPSITEAEIYAGFLRFDLELLAIRRPPMIRMMLRHSIKPGLFVGSAAVMALISIWWQS